MNGCVGVSRNRLYFIVKVNHVIYARDCQPFHLYKTILNLCVDMACMIIIVAPKLITTQSYIPHKSNYLDKLRKLQELTLAKPGYSHASKHSFWMHKIVSALMSAK